MFDRVLNAYLVFYRAAIFRITFFGSFFVLRLQATTLLKELGHECFFRNFPKFYRTATFQNSGLLLQISLEIFMSYFPCPIYFKKYVHIISFVWFFMKNLGFSLG